MRRLAYFCSLLLISGFMCFVGAPVAAKAACDALPSDKGQDGGSFTIDAAGSYTIWVRMLMPTNDSNSVAVKIDEVCPVIVGGDQSGAGFRWVSYGAALNLAAGTHAIVLAGHEVGAGVDRIMALADPGCVPTGAGDNCLGAKVNQLPTTSATTNQAPVKPSSAVTIARATPAHIVWLTLAIGAAALATVGFLWWIHHFRRVSVGMWFGLHALADWIAARLGGYTGDTLGAVQQKAEIAFLVVAALLLHH